MTNNTTHIIHRQRYELKVASQQQGRQLQQQIQQFNWQHLLPELNNRLNKWFGKSDEVVTIDKLDIDIGNIHLNAAFGEWLDNIVQQLEQKLKPLSNRQKVETPLHENIEIKKTEPGYYAIESLLFFLVNGLLPQASIYRSISELFEAIQQLTNTDLLNLKSKLLVNDNGFIAQRLAMLPQEQLYFLVRIFLPELSTDDWNKWLKDVDEWSVIQILDADLESDFPTLLAIQNKQVVFFIQELMRAGQSQLGTSFSNAKEIARKQTAHWLSTYNNFDNGQETSEINRPENEDSLNQPIRADEAVVSEEGSFVMNAGICLIAPYLSVFFKALQLINGVYFLNNHVQQKAIYLLHFLATGDEDATEEKLVLAKLFCGWPLQMPLTEKIILAKGEKSEAIDLLLSVIEHWQALKSTSPDGLRQAFLQRSGKLSNKEDSFLLQVEHQSLDILLDQIPWSFHLIKLPWMKKTVTVEWY